MGERRIRRSYDQVRSCGGVEAGGTVCTRPKKKNNNQATEMRSRPPYTRRTTWLGETRGRAADANVDATLTRTYQLFVVYTHTHTSTLLYVCVCVYAIQKYGKKRVTQ